MKEAAATQGNGKKYLGMLYPHGMAWHEMS